ncbi:hypothetical protein Tdes44962_MAKER01085 [Teratosphaeria destructans]|uniref:Uncharacterized protein n=1 Tax=Teratosphaeria destructans TaxID=418781 RepID=A0A9W7VYD4_9PEZI|nr:hypothetical protein Tdes44962_MAKER01085 [Teratosphaeria destructans]
MLSTQHFTHNTPNIFLPAIPSPLSPRSANIYGPYHRPAQKIWMSGPVTKDEHHQIASPNFRPSGKENEARRRQNVKKAPSPKQDDLKERRRSMFLRSVREKREDKRFEARGEDIMRLDYMQRQRAWEAQLAREAKVYAPEVEAIGEDEEEYDLPVASGGPASGMEISSQPLPPRMSQADEADEVRRREEEELEAMVEMMEGQGTAERQRKDDETGRETNLWSDDDDYDELFSEVMGIETTGDYGADGQQGSGDDGGDVDMDML